MLTYILVLDSIGSFVSCLVLSHAWCVCSVKMQENRLECKERKEDSTHTIVCVQVCGPLSLPSIVPSYSFVKLAFRMQVYS